MEISFHFFSIHLLLQNYFFKKGDVDNFHQSEMSTVAGRNVVLIRNGKKSYGSGKNRKEILKDINMTVAEGAM